MPWIDRLRNLLKGKPFEVLAVKRPEPLSRIQKYSESLPLGFPLLRDRDGSAGKAWRAEAPPPRYLIPRDRRLRSVGYFAPARTRDGPRARPAQPLRLSPFPPTAPTAE